jgi:hypothetical protein
MSAIRLQKRKIVIIADGTKLACGNRLTAINAMTEQTKGASPWKEERSPKMKVRVSVNAS